MKSGDVTGARNVQETRRTVGYRTRRACSRSKRHMRGGLGLNDVDKFGRSHRVQAQGHLP